ncbi:MAG: tetraacyldisaccharide 4'-kinase [Nitrospiraceae bacterium]|nr:MAG: tetraacyldisaccharide 4'-kinase [Nitrospiraceae bacterium]
MGLLSAIYGLGLICRRLTVKPHRLSVRVISVGNLTLGGTGKTPAVIAITEEATRRGLKPCILTRGYKGKAKGPCFVPGFQDPEFSIQEYGDEPALMAERLRDVPIVKCADRYKGGQFALNSLPVTAHPSLIFILDDGFQHVRLHRDIDILLIDAYNPFGNERLFPEGKLREPLSSISRAHVIILTRADMARVSLETLTLKVRQYNADAPIFTASHNPSCLAYPSGETASPGMLRNKKIYAFAGIANPFHFRDILISLGADIISFKSFRDHHRYKQKDLDKIRAEAAGADIITTEKDMVKLRELRLPDNICALRIEFVVEDGFYNKIFNALNRV